MPARRVLVEGLFDETDREVWEAQMNMADWYKAHVLYPFLRKYRLLFQNDQHTTRFITRSGKQLLIWQLPEDCLMSCVLSDIWDALLRKVGGRPLAEFIEGKDYRNAPR